MSTVDTHDGHETRASFLEGGWAGFILEKYSQAMWSFMRRMRSHSFQAFSILLPLALFLAVAFAGCLYTAIQPRIYMSQARLWIQPRLPTDEKMQNQVYAPLTSFFTNPLSTTCELLRSQAVLNTARQILSSQLPPGRCPAVEQLNDMLEVVPAREADIVVVRCRSSDPGLAVAAVQSVVDSFLRLNSEQMRASASQTLDFLQGEVKRARESNEQARGRLKRFENEEGAVNIHDQVQSLLAQKTRNDNDLQETSLKVAEKKAELANLQSRLRMTPEQLDAAGKLAADPTVESIRKEIGKRELALVQLTARLRDTHPRVVRAKAAIGRLREALVARARELAGQAGASLIENQVALSDQQQQKLLADVADGESELTYLQMKLAKLQSAAGVLSAQLAGVPVVQQKIAELTDEVQATNRDLAEAEAQLRKAVTSKAVAATTSNIKVIDNASQPTLPISPDVPASLALSFALAAAAGAGLFYVMRFHLNPIVSNPGEVLDLLPLPLLGWIGRGPDAAGLSELLPAMHRVRLNWKGAMLEQEKKRIVVTNCTADGSVPLLASSLAMSIAQGGSRVSVLDLTGGRPSIAQIFGVKENPGLGQYLGRSASAFSVADLLHPVDDPGRLNIIPAGDRTAWAGKLDSRAFQELVEMLQQECDVLILAAPALGESLDAISLLHQNAFLLIGVWLGNSSKTSLRLAAAEVRCQKVKAGGIFLMGASDRSILSALNKGGEESENGEGDSSSW